MQRSGWSIIVSSLLAAVACSQDPAPPTTAAPPAREAPESSQEAPPPERDINVDTREKPQQFWLTYPQEAVLSFCERIDALGQIIEEQLTIVQNQTKTLGLGAENDRFVIQRQGES